MTEKSMADLAVEGLVKEEKGFRIFYKYQTINEYSLDALKRGYLYFSRYGQLNDPFDPFLMMVVEHVDDLSKMMIEKEIRIFCVTENENHPLMWAHYGNSFSGMRVGYAVFTGNPSLFREVKYTNNLSGKHTAHDLMTIKGTAWSYESEWRAIVSGGEELCYDIAHPISVCLGTKCSHDDMERVRNVLPKSVTEFEITYPAIDKAGFVLGILDVDTVLEHYNGKLPDFENLLKSKM